MSTVNKKKAIFRRLQSNDQIETRAISKGNKDGQINRNSIYSSKSSNQCSVECNGQKSHVASCVTTKKCSSFPKLAMAKSNAALISSNEICRNSPLTLSNTQLSCMSYNDSVSPQVSMDNLTLEDRDSYNGKWSNDKRDFQLCQQAANRREHHYSRELHMEIGDGAKMTDNRRHIAPFLSPNPHHKISPLISPRLVSRSTSCPSMTNHSKRAKSFSAITSPVSSKPSHILQDSGKRDECACMNCRCGQLQIYSKEGAEVPHCPRGFEPNETIRNHEFSQKDRELIKIADKNGDRITKTESPNHMKNNCSTCNYKERFLFNHGDQFNHKACEHRPMHTRKLHGSDREHWRLTHHKGYYRNIKQDANPRVKFTKGYVNIGDIPTSLAEKVISEREPYKPDNNLTTNVTKKCLQWLNSLDSDDESQGCS